MKIMIGKYCVLSELKTIDDLHHHSTKLKPNVTIECNKRGFVLRFSLVQKAEILQNE